MIKGLGTDILKVSRFKKVLDKHTKKFTNRLFTDEELNYSNQHQDNVLHLVGRFCAKEAVSKALGTGIGEHLSFKDIHIRNNASGKPFVELSSKAKKRFNDPKIEISISHCKEYATAIAIWH